MARRRRSKLCSDLFLICALASCAACGGATLDTALEIKDTARKPDGVLLEPAPAIPPAEEHGKAQAGVVALRQPISDEQLGEIVRSYIRAFVEGDRNHFGELLENDAVELKADGRTSVRGTLQTTFNQRIQGQHRAEYSALRGRELARLDRMERFGVDDLGPHSDPPRPMEMRSGDIYARVPLEAVLSPSTGDALFHNMLVIVVRRGADRKLRIAALLETDMP